MTTSSTSTHVPYTAIAKNFDQVFHQYNMGPILRGTNRKHKSLGMSDFTPTALEKLRKFHRSFPLGNIDIGGNIVKVTMTGFSFPKASIHLHTSDEAHGVLQSYRPDVSLLMAAEIQSETTVGIFCREHYNNLRLEGTYASAFTPSFLMAVAACAQDVVKLETTERGDIYQLVLSEQNNLDTLEKYGVTLVYNDKSRDLLVRENGVSRCAIHMGDEKDHVLLKLLRNEKALQDRPEASSTEPSASRIQDASDVLFTHEFYELVGSPVWEWLEGAARPGHEAPDVMFTKNVLAAAKELAPYYNRFADDSVKHHQQLTLKDDNDIQTALAIFVGYQIDMVFACYAKQLSKQVFLKLIKVFQTKGPDQWVGEFCQKVLDELTVGSSTNSEHFFEDALIEMVTGMQLDQVPSINEPGEMISHVVFDFDGCDLLSVLRRVGINVVYRLDSMELAYFAGHRLFFTRRYQSPQLTQKLETMIAPQYQARKARRERTASTITATPPKASVEDTKEPRSGSLREGFAQLLDTHIAINVKTDFETTSILSNALYELSKEPGFEWFLLERFNAIIERSASTEHKNEVVLVIKVDAMASNNTPTPPQIFSVRFFPYHETTSLYVR